LKTFYASVECVERNLNPFETNLVVADPSRGPGSICLAISPKMKARGIKNRCRIYEIPKSVKYIVAKPRMKKYIEYAAKVYSVYLDFVSKISLKYANYTEVLPTIYPDYDTLVNVYRSALQKAFNAIAFVPNRDNNRLLRIREVLMDKTGVSKGIISLDRMLNHLNSKKNTHFSKDSFVDDNGILEYAHNLIYLFDSNELIHLLADKETISGISIQEDIKLIRFLSEYFKQPLNQLDS
jgi:hypothetical protein